MLHSFSLTFKGGVDLYCDQRADDQYIQKEFDDGTEEPATPKTDALMNSETKFTEKRVVVTPVVVKNTSSKSKARKSKSKGRLSLLQKP